MKEALDEILATGIEQSSAPGVTAIVVNRDGVLYDGGFGERKLGEGPAMTTDTVGSIFSMTKAITAAAAMQLVERGKIDLTAPASEVCPDLAAIEVLTGFDGDGQPVTRPPKSAITLNNLLTHTSGFVYDIWSPELGRWHEATGTPNVLSLQKAALCTPLAFDPGTRWQYGIGIDWVGQMVEAVTGQTLSEYFAEHITGPLRMADTAFAHTDSMLERASAMHARMPDGSLAPIELSPPENPEFEMGGGGLQGTMSDYGKFIRMILNDGELDGTRVLSADTVSAMAANQIGDLRVEELKTATPQFSNDAEFFPGDAKSWGYSFQINEVPGHTGRAAGTLMWAGLANSFFWIDRTNGVGGAFMTQILPFADKPAIDLFYNFEQAVYTELQ